MYTRTSVRSRVAVSPVAVQWSLPLLMAFACAGGEDTRDGAARSPEQEVAPAARRPVELPSEIEDAPASGRTVERSRAEAEVAGSPSECEDTCASKRAECGVVCEETCGECPSGERCENGRCVCTSSCDGSRCIDDCGKACACPLGSTCDGHGFCVAAEGCGDGPCPTEIPRRVDPLPAPPLPAPEQGR